SRLPPRRGCVDHVGPTGDVAEPQAVAAVEAVRIVGTYPSQPRQPGDQKRAAHLVPALVPADEAGDAAGTDVGNVWRRQREHGPTTIISVIVQSVEGRDPARRRLVVSAGEHCGD